MTDDLELEALRLTREENGRRKALGMTPDEYVFVGDVISTLRAAREAETNRKNEAKRRAIDGFYG
jgi:methionine salvage enolase-phosphatase E1